jgi:hypothetical protein
MPIHDSFHIDCEIEHSDVGLQLTGLRKGSTVVLSIPYVSVSRADALAVSLTW